MADTDCFDDCDVVARTIWGEARGEGLMGMGAVASVILNRLDSGVTWWGDGIRSICLKPFQFSCWNMRDPNRPKMFNVTEDDAQFRDAMNLAEAVVDETLADTVEAADSYYDLRLPYTPQWATKLRPAIIVGHHAFFRTVAWADHLPA